MTAGQSLRHIAAAVLGGALVFFASAGWASESKRLLREALNAYFQSQRFESARLLLLLAEAGDADAAYLLVARVAPEHTPFWSKRGDSNREFAKALTLVEAAAEKGHIGALRFLYDHGPSNERKLYEWLEEAGKRGKFVATQLLALQFDYARFGRDEREIRARTLIELLEKAHAAGDLDSTFSLMTLYQLGHIAEANPKRAFVLSRVLAERGGRDVLQLAQAYSEGKVTDRNPREALKWYYIARMTGDRGQEIRDRVSAIESELRPPDWQEAESAAKEFLIEQVKPLSDMTTHRGKVMAWIQEHRGDQVRRWIGNWLFNPGRFDPNLFCVPPMIEQIPVDGWYRSRIFHSCMMRAKG